MGLKKKPSAHRAQRGGSPAQSSPIETIRKLDAEPREVSPGGAKAPSPFDTGLHLTLNSGQLQARLPSGHSFPISSDEAGLRRLLYLLMMQAKGAAEDLRAAKLASTEVPTLAYLDHYAKHVDVLVPIKDERCPFCRASALFPTVFEGRGEIARISRAKRKKEIREFVFEAEDLGL